MIIFVDKFWCHGCKLVETLYVSRLAGFRFLNETPQFTENGFPFLIQIKPSVLLEFAEIQTGDWYLNLLNEYTLKFSGS